MKKRTEYYYIWIEGLSPRTGEKVKSLHDGGIQYTTKITEAMRISKKDKENFKEILSKRGIADWALGDNSFVTTSYAPPKTL